MQKIRNWLYRFMSGRNGPDTISKLMFIPMIIFFVISLFTKDTTKIVFNVLAWSCIIYAYFRMFSKNVNKRRQENAWFQKKMNYIKMVIKDSKKYRFFKCPNCGAHLRVPRGVGNVTISCKKCGHEFDGKA